MAELVAIDCIAESALSSESDVNNYEEVVVIKKKSIEDFLLDDKDIVIRMGGGCKKSNGLEFGIETNHDGGPTITVKGVITPRPEQPK